MPKPASPLKDIPDLEDLLHEKIYRIEEVSSDLYRRSYVGRLIAGQYRVLRKWESQNFGNLLCNDVNTGEQVLLRA